MVAKPKDDRRRTDGIVNFAKSADAITTSFAGRMWDWADRRQIFERFVSLAVLYGTVKITGWSMAFAEHGDRPGIEVAAIVAAVAAPYMALQAAAIAFLLKARPVTP